MDKGQKCNPNTESFYGGQNFTEVQFLADSQAKISALTFPVNLFDCRRG